MDHIHRLATINPAVTIYPSCVLPASRHVGDDAADQMKEAAN